MARAKRTSPAGLTLAAAASLGLILVLAGVTTVRVLAADRALSQRPSGDSAARHGSRIAEPAIGNRTPNDDTGWSARLNDSTCDDACLGGSACAATGNTPCPSKFTCVLGNRGSKLDPDMPLDLRLASLVGPENALDLCTLNLVVCLTPASAPGSTCVPISDPCRHDGRATVTVPIVTHDLVSDGIGISIRRGSSSGPEIATGTIRYGTPIRRVGLCSGFKFGGLTNAPGYAVRYVTFFVEPRR